MRKCRTVKFVRSVHAIDTEGRRGVPHERDVVAEFRCETAGSLDARVRQESDDDYVGDLALLEQEVEIGIGKTARAPMLLCDKISGLRSKVRMPVATPAAFSKHFGATG